MGFVYIIYYFYKVVADGGNIASALNLNIVNMLFLFLGLLAHGDLRRYVDAIGDASTTAAGILLQFPFYAGIMGMMVGTNENGVSLASAISNGMMAISNEVTFPMMAFLSAGIVNFFVPSGGGQWAVQAPIVMPAADAMGIEPGRAAMAIAWGDQWTNMIQPFWALPALGVAGLSAKDIMGYLVIVLDLYGYRCLRRFPLLGNVLLRKGRFHHHIVHTSKDGCVDCSAPDSFQLVRKFYWRKS